MTTERPREITAHHLAGSAGVYVRQSSERQVEQNQGSAEYQRRQERWALAWGWPPTSIKFYVDAGLSGTAAAHRPEFLSLREEITAGRLRAVFAADQSRLARNAVEWIDFLNLCRIRHVILVIDGRVIHSGEDGDAFSSSIVALVDEFENRKRRAVFERGRLGKIAAGKAITSPPTGYVSRKDGGWDLDPDRDVQVGIAEVFRVFQEQRSSSRTVRRLVADGRLVPRRKPGRTVRWVRPSVRAILGIVGNPVYSGRYVYRQRTADESRGRDRRGHTRIRVTKAHERLVIADHHPAYITQEQADEIRAIIDANAPSKSRRNLGPGSALLQGAIGCAKHQGRGMAVDYRGCQQSGREGQHYYHCHGDYEIGGAQCWVVPGKQVDRAVAQALFGKLVRPALEEIRSGWASAKGDVVRQRSGESLAVEQARCKVDDLRARYDAVSPALRHLAERLEVDLNDALGEYTRAREQSASASSETDLFTDDAFEELIALCGDLPALFFADTTVHRDRKEIFRTLIDRVIVTAASRESLSFAIRWADGSPPTDGVAYTARHAHALIRRWAADGVGNPEIARRLNELDLKTSRGRHWTTPTVWQVQDYELRTAAAAKTKKRA